MFKIPSTPLEQINLKEGLSSSESGAFICFEGLVRNYNEGKEVIALEYEAHETLCQNEAQKIFQETRSKFNIINVKCFHRVGKLAIGEMAVWVAVTAAHRDDAFKACRYVIDELINKIKEEYSSAIVHEFENPEKHIVFALPKF